jgi:hypothetical protein
MSTGAIERVLAWAKQQDAGIERAADDALVELAAIRRAARGLSQTDPRQPWDQDRWDDALFLIEQIAKESKPSPG